MMSSENNLQNRLDELATKIPGKPALIFFNSGKNNWDYVTYKDLHLKAQAFTHGLQSLLLSSENYPLLPVQQSTTLPGPRAALMVPPSVDFFALVFALLKTQVVPIIVDPAIGLQNVSNSFTESQPDIFIGNWQTHLLRKTLGWGKNTIRHNLTLSDLILPDYTPTQTTNPKSANTSSPAAVIYTSGSTGSPKGVILTHGNLLAQLDLLRNTFNINPDEIDLPAFPVFALIDILLGITAIVPDINFPQPARIDPKRVVEGINRFQVSTLFASPILLDNLASYAQRNATILKPLKRAITAGAPAPLDVIQNFRKILPDSCILNGIYGATESLPITSIDCQEILEETNHKTMLGAGVCIGKPITGVCVRIIKITDSSIINWSEDIVITEYGSVGEITVKGPSVTTQYLSSIEQNELAKIHDGNEIVHRMGDLGYFDVQGRLWFCGRKSHRIETEFGPFFTEQIEGLFNAHPKIYRTAVVGVFGKPVLWVELNTADKHTDKKVIIQELIQMAKNHTQASKIHTFLFKDKFPTDVRHNSKIIREKLAFLALEKLR